MLGGDPVGIWDKNSSGAFGHIGLLNKLWRGDGARDISISRHFIASANEIESCAVNMEDIE